MIKLTPVEKIYQAFYDSRTQRLYYRQIQQLTKLSDSSLQNALKKLKDEIIVDKQKGNTFYILPKNSLTKINFTKLDLLKIDTLEDNVKRSVNRLVNANIDGVAFILLFGSAARKEQKKNSDIDILVVTNNISADYQKKNDAYVKKKMNEIIEKINAVSIYPLSLFYANVGKFANTEDRLIKEATLTGFCIFGNMQYHEMMLKNAEDYQ